jgi:IS30 family transposase
VRHLTSRLRQQQLDWRRSQILQYSSQGYSIREIGQQLQLDKSLVSRDIIFLRKEAQNKLQYHIHDVILIELSMSSA